ncbi:MAG: hypothetical protein ABIA76_05410 [Candidatus Diapherotrites archaeon]
MKTQIQEPEIQIIGINKKFNQENELINEIRKIFVSHPEIIKKPVFFVFPEAVFGGKAIRQQDTKPFLEKLHQTLAMHGNAYAFFSMHETEPAGHLTNTGLIVMPKKEKGMYFKSYSKLAAVKTRETVPAKPGQKVKTRELIIPPVIDQEIMKQIEKAEGKNEREHRRRWFERAKEVQAFPNAEIEGNTVELRVCADAREGKKNYQFKARKRKEKKDFIIIPAQGAFTKQDIEYIRSRLNSKGFGIILDYWSKKLKVIGKTGRTTNFPELKKPATHKEKRFTIRHII